MISLAGYNGYLLEFAQATTANECEVIKQRLYKVRRCNKYAINVAFVNTANKLPRIEPELLYTEPTPIHVDYIAVIDLLAQAIAASLTMTPRRWMAKFGGVNLSQTLPSEYRHLKDDYRETLKEMSEQIIPARACSVKEPFDSSRYGALIA